MNFEKKYTQKSIFKKNYTYFFKVCSLIMLNVFNIFQTTQETGIKSF